MTVWELTLLNKNGRISANNGPILKIWSEIQGVDSEQTNGRQTQIIV